MNEIIDSSAGTVSEWNDEQWANFKHWLKNLLHNEIVELVFIKSDGTQRVMKCTLDALILTSGVMLLEEKRVSKSETTGQSELKKSRPKPRENKENITVWDVEAEDWRSFKVRSLTNILTLIIKYDYREPSVDEFEVAF
jgi:hypothetical protein